MSEGRTSEPTVEETLDIQHDPFPAQDNGMAKRIPHLGHVALLLGLVALATIVAVGLFSVALRGRPVLRDSSVAQLALEAGIYLLTLAAAFRIFPLVWKRSFLAGIEWNGLAAKRYWPRLMAIGVGLCALSQLGERFFNPPKQTDLDKVLSSPGGAWGAMLLGVLLAPVCEEILFRGFLLPAFATAYDWLSLERTPAGLQRWQRSTDHTVPAQVFGALLSSLFFGLLHAPQLHYSWGAAFLIACVGLVLAVVRLRTHSLACSTVVHMTYNGILFGVMLVMTRGFTHLERLQS